MRQSLVAGLVGTLVFGVGLQVGVTMFGGDSVVTSAGASPTVSVAEKVADVGATTSTTHSHADPAATPADVAAPADDKGLALLSNGHHHAMGAEKPLSADDRLALSQQIAATIEVAKRLPTVADAEAAGYRRAGPYSPGLGAHYTLQNGQGLNSDGNMTADDLASPLAIIYDGTEPTSRVAGFMYYSMASKEPTGFAGTNDVWHYHTSLCLKANPDHTIDAPFGADKDATKEQCDGVGGFILKQTQWMVHVWSVPGYESAQGLFGEVNPALACPDGTYYQRPADEWGAHLLNSCKSAA